MRAVTLVVATAVLTLTGGAPSWTDSLTRPSGGQSATEHRAP
jgi:hypothetical protein